MFMAKLVGAVAMSHSPMFALEGKYWGLFAEYDSMHPMLYDEKGNHLTYEELAEQRQDKYKLESTPEKLNKLYEDMEAGYDRLKQELKKMKPDLLVVVSNDHKGEFLDPYNIPSLGVYYGDKIISTNDQKRKSSSKKRYEELGAIPEAYEQMTTGMGMDKNNIWPGKSDMALHIIQSLMDQNFDVGILKEPDDPNKNGHGHGYGMIFTKLMEKDSLVPIVPIYINAFPPNVMSPSRCYDLGKSLRQSIAEMPDDLRVCVVASGGLSHFVTDADLDQTVINALLNESEDVLRNLPRHLLTAGNAEILNWVTLGGCMVGREMDWHLYLPIYRTPAGSGIGLTFAKWT
jgi:hypothetical protein